MAKNRHKGNRFDEAFVGIPYSVLNSPLFLALSPYAVKLLIDLMAQHRGRNNGDLSAAWKLMQPRGWRSEATLHKAKHELIEAGFLFEARKGHRPNVCSLFALTWFLLDPNDKFDAGASNRFVRGEYRLKVPLTMIPAKAQNAALTPARVAVRAA